MLTKTKILAICKDPMLIRLLKTDFISDVYDVSFTQDTGISLKNVISKEIPDFVILDIMMPSLDGIEICLQVRQWTQAPIMMLSTWGTAGDVVRGLNLGSEDFLTEPFGIAELKSRINNTLLRGTFTMTEPLTNVYSGSTYTS